MKKVAKLVLFCLFMLSAIFQFTGCAIGEDNIEYTLNLTLTTDAEGVHIAMIDEVSRAVSQTLNGELLNANRICVKRRVQSDVPNEWDFVGYVQRGGSTYLYATDCFFDDYFVDSGVTYEYVIDVSLYDSETQESTELSSIPAVITTEGGYGETTCSSTVSYTYETATGMLNLSLSPEISIICPEIFPSPYHIGIHNGDRRYDWNHTLTQDEMANGIYLTDSDLLIPEIGHLNGNSLFDTPVNISFWMEFMDFCDDGLITTWRVIGDISGPLTERPNAENPGVKITIPSGL